MIFYVRMFEGSPDEQYASHLLARAAERERARYTVYYEVSLQKPYPARAVLECRRPPFPRTRLEVSHG